MIKPGAKADLSFRVRAWSPSGSGREVPFAELLGRRTVVSVYMKGGTPGCDRQVEGLSGFAAELEKAGSGNGKRRGSVAALHHCITALVTQRITLSRRS